jgi:hypothetical protein
LSVDRSNSHKTSAGDHAYIRLIAICRNGVLTAGEIFMNTVSRRNLLAVTAGGSLVAAAVQAHAQPFGAFKVSTACA